MTHHRQSAFVRAALVLAAAASAAALTGCKDEPKPAATPAPPAATPAAKPAAAGTVPVTIGGVTIQRPANWTVVPSPATRSASATESLFLQGPASKNESAFVLIEIQPVDGAGDLTDVLEKNVDYLSRKTDFKLRTQGVKTHPNGFDYAFVDFANTSDVQENTPMRQWSVLAPLPGKKRVQFQAGSAATIWSENEPAIQAMLDSMKLPK
ncbi:MAG TPA: hypothetical protein VF796_04285 [Humisphaera sp.]